MAVVDDQFTEMRKQLDIQMQRTAELQRQVDLQRRDTAELREQLVRIHDILKNLMKAAG